MNALRYLNTMLTVIALLLAAQLWTHVTSEGVAVSVAHAAPVVKPGAADEGGIPNAGAQRKEMIDLLRANNQSLDDLKQLLTSGKVRVKLESVPGDKK